MAAVVSQKSAHPLPISTIGSMFTQLSAHPEVSVSLHNHGVWEAQPPALCIPEVTNFMLCFTVGYYKVALCNMWHVLRTMLHQTSHGWLNAETLERAPISISCRLVRCSAHEHSFASLQYLQLRFHSLWHVLVHFIEVSEFSCLNLFSMTPLQCQHVAICWTEHYYSVLSSPRLSHFHSPFSESI